MVSFTKHAEQDGVSEYDFDVTVDGERIPCALWAPAGAQGPRPLILMSHGGGQHKKAEQLVTRARHYAGKHGWATLSTDALGHGERVDPAEAEAMVKDLAARVQGETANPGPSPFFKTMGERVRRIVPEWRAALDAAQSLDFIGSTGPVGYWGLSLGLIMGIPFLATEPRIHCAVLGLGGLRPKDDAVAAAARAITIPVEFTFQWDDAAASRDGGIALFNAFGSIEKSMHINPGGHVETPLYEHASWEAFFLRHFAKA